MAQASKTQIDRLGARLRKGAVEKSDLILLDGYRRSFGHAYESVVQTIHDQLKLEPSGRPAKSTNSLIEKLKRESIRLTQVQDIAGCRVVVADITKQDLVVDSLIGAFPKANVVDRREKPSYGYRAVHVIVEMSGKTVEIQVRTRFQHIWAEISEKYADLYGSEIKYGGGEPNIRWTLEHLSNAVAGYDDIEKGVVRLDASGSLRKLRDAMEKHRKNIAEVLDEVISSVDNKTGDKR
jgi:putative GTP pyrophosphokinase